jgi:hypothetical protein
MLSRTLNNLKYYYNLMHYPIMDENGTILKYLGARYHITDDTLAEALYEKQMLQLFA